MLTHLCGSDDGRAAPDDVKNLLCVSPATKVIRAGGSS
jgi:hypothetical protein